MLAADRCSIVAVGSSRCSKAEMTDAVDVLEQFLARSPSPGTCHSQAVRSAFLQVIASIKTGVGSAAVTGQPPDARADDAKGPGLCELSPVPVPATCTCWIPCAGGRMPQSDHQTMVGISPAPAV